MSQEEQEPVEADRSVLGRVMADVIHNAIENGMSNEEAAARAAEALEATLPDFADHIATKLHMTKLELVDGLERDRSILERDIEQDYKTAFNNYTAAAHIAYELGARAHEDYVDSGLADDYPAACQALFLLQGRACTVGAEVLHLLRGGYGDGANARHRTLHEIAVVMDLLASDLNDDLGRRYLAYASIERYYDMVTYQKHCEAMGYTPFEPGEVAQAERERRGVLDEFGTRFTRRNQWAAPLFPEVKDIPFTLLEEKAGIQHKRPFYLFANHHVHAGPRAAILNLHSLGLRSSIGVGARSGELIGETAHGALIHLQHCTSSLICHLSEKMDVDLDIVLGLVVLKRFVAHAGVSFERAGVRIGST